MNVRQFFPGISIKKARSFFKVLFRQVLPLVMAVSLLASFVVTVDMPSSVSAQGQGEETAKYLPQDTDLYLTVNLDLEADHLADFWRVVNNWWGNPNVKAKWNQWINQADAASGINIETDILPWLGPEIALGITNISAQFPEEPVPLLFIGTMDKAASDAAFEKYKTWRMEESGGDLTFSNTSYRGQVIAIGGQEYYGFTAGYILLSNNEAAVHDAIDLILDGGDSLAGTADFKAAQTALPERAGMFYYNSAQYLDDIAGIIPEQESGIPQQFLQNLAQVYSQITPSYFAASLKFTATGITSTGYFPIPEAVTFPVTEAAELQAVNIVPGNALFFASLDMKASHIASIAYSKAFLSQAFSLTSATFDESLDEIIALINENSDLDKNVEDIWAQDIAPYLGDLAGMSPEEAINQLAGANGVYLEQYWAEIAPYLKELAGMSLAEAIVNIDQTFDLNMEEDWAEIAPNLGELSGMSFEQAMARLGEVLGLDVTWEEKIAPVLNELSGKSYQQAIVYLLNLNENWGGIAAHLNQLSGKNLKDAVKYFLDEIVTKSLEDTLARFDQTMTDEFGESAIALLPPSSIGGMAMPMPDLLLISEVKDTAKAQEDMNTLTELIKLLAPVQVSQQAINGVTATMIEGEALLAAGISPGYLFLDAGGTNYLVIGSTRGSLEAAVNAKQTPSGSLSQAEEYQGLLFQLGEVRGSLIYLNLTGILGTALSETGMDEQQGWLLDALPLKSALGYTYPILGETSITMTGALYLLPPALIEQSIAEGTSGSLSIPEQAFDLSKLDVNKGQSAVKIDVDINNAPANASIKITIMDDTPADIRSGFELAATNADLDIIDIAYVVRVDKTNITSDNIGAATITLKVGMAWVEKYGIDKINILRIGDNGVKEVLPTEFKDFEGSQAVFEGISANGLSYFALAAATAGSGGGTNLALIIGLIAGAVVLIGIVVIILVSRRARPSGATV